VKYITRFTEDCFASLVALIFIMDAIKEILKLRKRYPINYQPNVPLDYSCLCLGFNKTIINNTNVTDLLYGATTLDPTLKKQCAMAGGILNGTGCDTPVYADNVFFFSVLLFIFTFFICIGLQEFRHSTFFPTKVNRKRSKVVKYLC
jgi:hypothetical protein